MDRHSPPPGVVREERSEDQLGLISRIFEQSPSMVLVAGSDGIVRYVNAKFTEVTGYREEDSLGQHITVLGRFLPRIEDSMWQTVATGRGWRGEVESRKKDGCPYRVDLSLLPVQSSDGAVSHFIATADEVCEGGRATWAGEERYRILYEDNPSMYFTVDLRGVVLSVNRFGAEQLGYRPDELVGRSVLDVFHPEDRDAVREQLAHCGEDLGSVFTWECRKLHKEGGVLWVKETARTVADVDGRPIVLVVCEDVTERRRAEDALLASEERYRFLYEDNPTMFFTVDSDGLVLSVNRFGAVQLGYEPEELLGNSVFDVFHEEDRQAVREQLALCWNAPGDVAQWEFRKLRKDGRVIWVKEIARVARDATGNPTVLIVCEDITERKEAEEAIQQMREDLERRVERTLRRGSVYGLSFRELMVLHLVASGRLDKEIGALLGISHRTAQTHITHILKKMKASTRTEAGVRAIREGLIR